MIHAAATFARGLEHTNISMSTVNSLESWRKEGGLTDKNCASGNAYPPHEAMRYAWLL